MHAAGGRTDCLSGLTTSRGGGGDWAALTLNGATMSSRTCCCSRNASDVSDKAATASCEGREGGWVVSEQMQLL